MHIDEMRNEDGIFTRVFRASAGGGNPGDSPAPDEDGAVRISVKSPASFADVVAPEGVVTNVKKSGGWYHLRLKIDGAKRKTWFVGGNRVDHFSGAFWEPGEEIVTFRLVGAEGFVGRPIFGGVSAWPDRPKYTERFGPHSNEDGGEPSPWA